MTASLENLQHDQGLGLGEFCAISLAQEMRADLVLLDELKARRTAREAGLTVIGCVGALEAGFRRKLVPDLRKAYADLWISGAYVSPQILDRSLESLGMPALPAP